MAYEIVKHTCGGKPWYTIKKNGETLTEFRYSLGDWFERNVTFKTVKQARSFIKNGCSHHKQETVERI